MVGLDALGGRAIDVGAIRGEQRDVCSNLARLRGSARRTLHGQRCAYNHDGANAEADEDAATRSSWRRLGRAGATSLPFASTRLGRSSLWFGPGLLVLFALHVASFR